MLEVFPNQPPHPPYPFWPPYSPEKTPIKTPELLNLFAPSRQEPINNNHRHHHVLNTDSTVQSYLREEDLVNPHFTGKETTGEEGQVTCFRSCQCLPP